eukprot:scaffold3024_cov27-Prasinocladus_malaysianus.AAC.1
MRPSGSLVSGLKLEAAIPQALVGDFETVRQELEIDQWMLLGGSWGVTLALAYAQAHPDRKLGMRSAMILYRLVQSHWDDSSGHLPDERHRDRLDVPRRCWGRVSTGDSAHDSSDTLALGLTRTEQVL